MHASGANLLVLLVLLVGTVIAPLLAGRIRVPAAVLLIAYGLAVGPHGLDWVGDSPVESFLSELGFVLLMFLAGLEIDVNALGHRGSKSLAVMGAVALLVPALSVGAAFLLDLPVLYGLALGAVSVGMPLALLKESGRIRTRLGQDVLILGSIGEFFTVVAMTLLDLGLRHGATLALLGGLLRLVGFLVISGLILKVFTAWAWWHPERVSGLVTEPASEFGVRASLLAMATFSVIAFLAGVEPIVGAFLAGALIAFVLRGKGILEEKLSVVGHGFLVPIFFVGVGLRFDPSVVTTSSLSTAGGLVVLAFLARALPALLLLALRMRLRHVLATAALLSCPLTLTVAIATLGAHLGAITEEAEGTLVLLAVGSGLVFPMAFRRLARQ
ncbi:MAG: cation:proton antiporter [Deltaproteobacteria bacterium]|nr:cation:proton antiporter [Deltaproteobacteria bacterium]